VLLAALALTAGGFLSETKRLSALFEDRIKRVAAGLVVSVMRHRNTGSLARLGDNHLSGRFMRRAVLEGLLTSSPTHVPLEGSHPYAPQSSVLYVCGLLRVCSGGKASAPQHGHSVSSR